MVTAEEVKKEKHRAAALRSYYKHRAKHLKRYAEKKDWYAAYRRRRKFSLSEEAYQRLLEQQNGVCAICKRPPKGTESLAVDHCHKTNKIRGLLCKPCNLGLGCFGDSVERMQTAIEYLSR